jgi:hypothetical protein
VCVSARFISPSLAGVNVEDNSMTGSFPPYKIPFLNIRLLSFWLPTPLECKTVSSTSSHPIPISICKMQIENQLQPLQQLSQRSLHFALVARACCIPGILTSFHIPTAMSLPRLSPLALCLPPRLAARAATSSDLPPLPAAQARDPSWRGTAGGRPRAP